MTCALQPADFFLIRIPLLPFNTVHHFHQTTNRNTQSFIDELRRLFSDPLMQEAVFLASVPLYDETLKWLNNPNDSSLKLPLALYRYLIRMCTRCTPYGLFAGCTTGTISDKPSSFHLPQKIIHQKIKRLDMGYLSTLLNELVNTPTIREQILFYPNDSIYNIGDSSRYFEYQLSQQRRQYFISAFARNEFIDELLETATDGASLNTLSEVLTSQDIAEPDAQEFINTLINNQVLVPGLVPAISEPGDLQFTTFFKKLTPIKELLQIQQTGVASYKQISSLLDEQFPSVPAKAPVQVDLFYPNINSNISNTVIVDLLSDLEKLSPLASAHIPTDLNLFKEQFLQRYEQQEIPLMIALDSDIGIGYGLITGGIANYTPLVDDLILPGKDVEQSLKWNSLTQFVWQQFLQSQQQENQIITIKEEDLQKLSEQLPTVTMPNSLVLMGSLMAENTQQLENKDYKFLLKTCSGPNALALLGRFGAGNPELATYMRNFARTEQSIDPEKIFAEIIHLPEGRIGNVLLRPKIYDYEIHFLGKSSVDTSYQIPVSDLYVSVRNDKVVLRSQRLNKEVIPRLTSAHNFVRGLAIYKFLADLQQQVAIGIQWNWGALLEQPFLPRVAFKHLILQRARWYITSEYYQQLLLKYTPEEALKVWQKKYNAPDFVFLTEGDNELLIDLNNEFACTLLIDKLNKADVVLYETLMDDNDRLLSNEDGSFCNELIIPLKNSAYHHNDSISNNIISEHIQRSFPPGSEWLYIKIYCGFAWIDKLLVNALYPLIQQLQAVGMVDRWFFIRYQDPDAHLRIRLHLTDPGTQLGYVLQQVHNILQSYLDAKIVQRIQLDTYVRETERYAAEYMELSEQFFWHDSEMVAYLLSIPGLRSVDRWLLALKGANTLLDAAGLSPVQKLALFQQLQQQFFTEHRGNDDLMLQLNKKFREHRKQIELALENSEAYALNEISTSIFDRRTSSLQKVFNGQIPEFLLPHYLHMFLNRMFTANARMQELVIYHYLMKYYSSVVARG
ncbi:hypothetical protein DVR12_05685 [Chitinophaga silvatica]|uniref:Thiopeptide-type bacteriocin biosynthesis domain-containing protein n=1 Tax=Chitinophaga silvatica TaxID=2282649 RepID=A0A3E1YDT6_9BACT|nr:lantibiotic dehydratase [Chitinophaga silvatica]RFS24692.1 hypothetical protein DVR12_05685 [Chitinophaga silvatica]